MAETVAIGPAEADGLDRHPRCGIRSAPVNAGANGREAGELRLETKRVQLRQPIRHLSHRPRPRAVGAIPVEDTPRVDGDEHT
ncbi:MAG: hypothetical protein HW413_1737 [Thermoleophilia bacterium]|nr:hypothetical protein [Thermoleophilia bacterium]